MNMSGGGDEVIVAVTPICIRLLRLLCLVLGAVAASYQRREATPTTTTAPRFATNASELAPALRDHVAFIAADETAGQSPKLWDGEREAKRFSLGVFVCARACICPSRPLILQFRLDYYCDKLQ